MRVFISHHAGEKVLALAWRRLLTSIDKTIEVWFSSDPAPDGGAGIGDWRAKIYDQLHNADLVMATITPESAERPWLQFELGMAKGMEKANVTIPVVYFMEPDDGPTTLRVLNAFHGDQEQAVAELCLRIVRRADEDPSVIEREPRFKRGIKTYMKTIRRYQREKWPAINLFHSRFHNTEAGRIMAGAWHACWAGVGENDRNPFLEQDHLDVWTRDDRVRLVGHGHKGSLYAMEGVVSWGGNVALSYWSPQQLAICGTALLKPVGAGLGILEGTWSGYTVTALGREALQLFQGEVIMSRDENVVEDWRAQRERQDKRPTLKVCRRSS